MGIASPRTDSRVLEALRAENSTSTARPIRLPRH